MTTRIEWTHRFGIWWSGVVKGWRVADGPDGIEWPWSSWPSFDFIGRHGWRFWLRCRVSLTGAAGRPYLWIGPFVWVF